MAVPMKTTVPHLLTEKLGGLLFDYPHNIQFRQQDMICNSEAAEQYDFILCLSVTKWIHLLHGDEGIRVLFRKIYSLLKPGGRLILEPQTWKSYHKRKFTSAKTEANYGRIQLRPKDFPLCLIDEIGFKSSEFIRVCQTSSKGFRRPIYVIQK
ncbi:unnamed protein product [Albugo candida]|uniref:RNA methyltransferase n=1 Tax=Albugo candida TaxID=65357 RepID=A0A024GUA0_9STRA|nr:unnamed protein product [Albugo candida]|eukprot:CCI50316.1 unnamed protein product [Albugo candida]